MSQKTSINEDSWWSSSTVNENLIRQLSLKDGGTRILGTNQQDNDIPISGSGKISYKSFNKKQIRTRMYLIPNNCTWNGERDDNVNDRSDYWDSRGEFHIYLNKYLVVSWTVYRFKLDNDSKNDMVIARGICYNDFGVNGPFDCQKDKYGSTAITNCRSLGDYRWLVMLPVSMSEAPHPNGNTYYGLQHLSPSPIDMAKNTISNPVARWFVNSKDQYRAGYYVSASFRDSESYSGGGHDHIQGPVVIDLCTRVFSKIIRSNQSSTSDYSSGMISWYSPTDRSFCITTDAGRDNVLTSAIDFLVIGETADIDGDK